MRNIDTMAPQLEQGATHQGQVLVVLDHQQSPSAHVRNNGATTAPGNLGRAIRRQDGRVLGPAPV